MFSNSIRDPGGIKGAGENVFLIKKGAVAFGKASEFWGRHYVASPDFWHQQWSAPNALSLSLSRKRERGLSRKALPIAYFLKLDTGAHGQVTTRFRHGAGQEGGVVEHFLAEQVVAAHVEGVALIAA